MSVNTTAIQKENYQLQPGGPRNRHKFMTLTSMSLSGWAKINVCLMVYLINIRYQFNILISARPKHPKSQRDHSQELGDISYDGHVTIEMSYLFFRTGIDHSLDKFSRRQIDYKFHMFSQYK